MSPELLRDEAEFRFDFRFHADRSHCVGTQYFALSPGAHKNAYWVPGARFVDEYTFSLVEGIFEKFLTEYDHFGFLEVDRSEWAPIILALDAVAEGLLNDAERLPPFGSTLFVAEWYRSDMERNRRSLASLLGEMTRWLRETLIQHDRVSLLGL